MGAPRPPMDYLAQCSQMPLESMELARLNQSANLRKEFLQVLHELIESEVDARLARAMLEWRRSQSAFECPSTLLSPSEDSMEASPSEEMPKLGCCEQLAMAFQPDHTVLRAGDSQDEKLETQRGNLKRCASSRANLGASDRRSNCAASSSGRRAASARTSRAIASPNPQGVRSLQGRRLADFAEVAPRTNSAPSRLSAKDSAGRRCCGIFLPRQQFASAASAFVACGGALGNAS
jgi:hypothetical protein